MQHLHSILIQYRILIYILSPAIAFVTLLMAIRSRDRRYFFERLGFFKTSISPNRIWFHAASVGEVNGVLPLIHKMAERHPEQTFILTTGTPTGGAIAVKKLPPQAQHVYLPVDLPGAVNRFLRHSKARCAIIMETELWPNLYYACHKNNVPISIINARLSERTLKASAWMYKLYSETLSHVSKILARSEEDANGFMTIGATSSKIKVIGNIKLAPFDISTVHVLPEITRPYVLAASTHEDEEYQLAKLWIEKFPGRLLVIAPRHPKRRDKILKSISRITDKLAVRSLNQGITEDTVIYLADTLGELQSLYKGAEVVFMGGSLVPSGGHNILEPARFGKPIIFGPHMDNFKDETKLLREHSACIQVKSTDELREKLSEILQQDSLRERLSSNAANAVAHSSDIIERYISAIERPYAKFFPEDPFAQSSSD